MNKPNDGGPATRFGLYRVRVVVSGETLAFKHDGAGIEDLKKLLKESCDKALDSIFEGNPVTIESLEITEVPREGVKRD